MNAKKAAPRKQRNRPQEDFVSILSEMEQGDNRTTAIVAAALVENNLALAIMARLRGLTDIDQKRIFENRGILSDFSLKIEAGYLLNIYGHLVREDLDKIRQIRNQFAHHLEIRDFDHPEVAGKCDSLNALRFLENLARPRQPTPPTRREIFRQTAAHLGARFDLEARSGHQLPPGTALIGPEY
jgi:hypothetical protein